jgi:fatty-acyl-CoA synthase
MGTAHFAFWPPHSERHLITPATNLFYNAEVSATRYPDKAYLVFYDTRITFARFHNEALRVAGYLEKQCGVVHGDRVLLMMQNSPQFVIGYYGILRANAVVVPLNPMSVTQELAKFVADSGARTLLVSQELYPRVEPLLRDGLLDHVIVAAYSDYLEVETTLAVPDFIAAPRLPITGPAITSWKDVLAADRQPGPMTAGPDDLAVMPYTSGTTGQPKGCMHTHRSMMHTTVGSMTWLDCKPETTFLAVAPFFHVTGMQSGMNGPLYIGNTLVLLPRWDRDIAAQLVDRYRVGGWTAVPTMIQDFFLNPNLAKYDITSINRLSGGGAAMPAAIAQRLLDIGITYVEGYGLSETAAATHINPHHHAKKQCLGIPIYDVDSRVVDPLTLQELPPGETGEIVTHGPQVFKGYWNKPEDTAAAFVEIDGKRFLRTGDLGRTDEEGYFFMVDRLKRMINASGFKIWPAEVESTMYKHPAVKEACVIGTRDDYRGETVKAVIVLKPEFLQTSAQEILDWSRENMAAYKAPRIV